ncbi:MAG: hypothetical protein IJM32_07445 [Ruminococcus sp.]|nr:hypothetical protein [Ruminococcus sp.]
MMWQGGDKLPESAVRRIRRSIKLWLIVKILPFAAYIALSIVTKIVSDITVPISITVMCALFTAFLLWRSINRLIRIKRRDFGWCEGVTAGMLGRYSKGDTLVSVGFEDIKAFGHPIGLFYIRKGRPVYVVTLNILKNSFFRGGFINDPLVFKNKDN